MYCSVLYNKLKNMQNVVMKGEKMYKLKKKVKVEKLKYVDYENYLKKKVQHLH